jgi:protein gp37
MAEQTAIEWCDATFNPWIGCTKVSIASTGGGGCDHCYAEVSTPARVKRAAGVETWGPHGQRQRTSAYNWKQPRTWNAAADAFEAEHGRRRRVFCASLADVFDNAVPPIWRSDLFKLIGETPRLDWLLLTKRIGNAFAMMPFGWQDFGTPPNVWIGATVVNQAEADRDIPKLLETPAAKRFLSIEPMLGPISFDGIFSKPSNAADGTNALEVIDWVICGGESGHNARPMHPDWARQLRDQCAAAGTPFLFKQWGEWGDPDSIERTGLAHHGWFEQDRLDGGVPRHEWFGPFVNGVEMASQRPEVFKVGKKAAGRLLDGTEHNGFPCAA